MKIRSATPSDVEEILKLGKQVNEFKVSEEVITFWPKEILLNIVKSETDLLIVAEEEKIQGFIIINSNFIFKKATIENIFVRRRFRGKGLAEKLLSYSIEELKKKGCGYVCAMVETDNPKSLNFFEKSNFDKGINCIWMDKILEKSFKE